MGGKGSGIRKAPPDELLIRLYQDERYSSGQIAEKHGITRTTVCRHLRRLGITRPESGSNSRNRNFHKKQYKHGYPITFLPEHPRAINTGYVYDHVLVIEKEIGRTPKSNEPIHHIDYDRMNCNPNNLYLCKSNREHQLLHRGIEKIVQDLFLKGIIGFRKGKYYVV